MISNILSPIFSLLRFHKKKLGALLLFYLFFLYWLFPLNDMGDFVAVKVSELTARQIFVNFDTLQFNLVPQPGLALSNVIVETPFTPAITAKYLTASPSIMGLFSLKPGVSVHAEGLLGGEVDVVTRGGDKNPAGKRKQKIDLDISGLNLLEVSKFAQLPLNISGSLSANVNTQLDVDMVEQPQGNIELHAEKAVIGESSIMTPMMGPVAIPRINLQDIVLEGLADKGAIQVSKLTIGKPGSDIFLNATGRFEMRFEKVGTDVQSRLGAYDLLIKLSVGDTFKQQVGTYLMLLASYATAGNSYSFRISGPNIYSPPNISKAQ